MSAENSNVLTRREGGVLHLTLNRPQARNAMSLAMVDELLAALDAAEADGVTRIVVLRGAGGHFCAGADLKDMAAARAQPTEDSDPLAHVNARFGWLCAAFARTPLAVVAVVEGTVMGGGFGLACAADVTLAHASASFRLPETSLGLVPAQIAPYLVERLGFAEAKRLAVTGGRLDARTALTLRLVHELAEDDAALMAALARVLGEILACAPGAVAATKRLISQARLAPPESLIDDAAAAFSLSAQGAEGMEGTLAFLQKRKPSWAP
jgi:isohexenylglutaconyl-CoA hydratase